jgi:hypothetical protein
VAFGDPETIDSSGMREISEMNMLPQQGIKKVLMAFVCCSGYTVFVL